MADTQAEPKLLLPQLKPFYDSVIPLAWPIIRIACGWNLAGARLGQGHARAVGLRQGLLRHGLRAAMFWVWSALAIEFVGGIALIFGLFTRFWAAAAAIEMALITYALLEQRLCLARARLRIHAAVGPVLLRHRAARRRAVFARPQARQGALAASADRSAKKLEARGARHYLSACAAHFRLIWTAPHFRGGRHLRRIHFRTRQPDRHDDGARNDRRCAGS